MSWQKEKKWKRYYENKSYGEKIDQKKYSHSRPIDLKAAVYSSLKVSALWEALTPLARNEWICWVTIVKKKKTREEHLARLKTDIMSGKKDHVVGPGAHIADRVQKSGSKVLISFSRLPPLISQVPSAMFR